MDARRMTTVSITMTVAELMDALKAWKPDDMTILSIPSKPTQGGRIEIEASPGFLALTYKKTTVLPGRFEQEDVGTRG